MAGITLELSLLLLLLFAGTIVAGNCGQKKAIAQQFISHGYKSLIGAWPWHGAMFHRYTLSTAYACGVTILTERFVITAAHCTIDPIERQQLPASRICVKIGLTNLEAPERYAQQHDVDRIVRHDSYDEQTFEDDIALLKLQTEIMYTDYVQPICLGQGTGEQQNSAPQTGFIVGWGLDENFGLPKDLQETSAPIVSKKECIESDPEHYKRVYHEGKTFCAGHQNGTAAGPGDSGGGLFVHVGKRWVLRGIISNGKADPNTLIIDRSSLVVFTDVIYYLNWIKSHVGIDINNRFDTDNGGDVLESNAGFNNLLGIEGCGQDSYPFLTPEELKRAFNQYPWLVVVEHLNLMTYTLEDFCHGVLIHPKFVLTAAHCVRRRHFSTIRSVRLNDYRLDTLIDIFRIDGKIVRTIPERIAVQRLSAHPFHDKFSNNIALIKLSRPTAMTPICLPPRGSFTPTNKSFIIVGWKKTLRLEKHLFRNMVQIADLDACREIYAGKTVALAVDGSQICSAYNHDDGRDRCSPYLGSAPLAYVGGVSPAVGRYFLAAISSFGYANCKREDIPDVFSSVDYYADWIYDMVRRNE
ncbi:uncharacterized protein LOC129780218 [Toxorhynchites rutilus septentrionalis]|uniref:uncharacterized protein LOC129780218 n=1 Tax=Toxorhynchites rutilus septentrionalis TaxID=329112 RepID=UPI002478A4BF|nr:uncharacterized protein LOC129780218 [Toxorhynchites rutilus septentrionalis]